jgi:enoyl-CoA hydratase/carnithine racemase
MGHAVRYEVATGRATLTLDRVESRNALSPEIINGLGDGLSTRSSVSVARPVATS